MNIKEVKSAYTVNSKDEFLICNSGSALVVTLGSAVGNDETYYIKNIGAGTVTITPNSPDTIDGDSTKDLLQYESCIILDYDLNTWLVL